MKNYFFELFYMNHAQSILGWAPFWHQHHLFEEFLQPSFSPTLLFIPSLNFLPQLKAGAMVDFPSRIGDTPLFLAALRGQWPVFQALLAAGADGRRVTSSGNTALIMAAQGTALPDSTGDYVPIIKKVCPLSAFFFDVTWLRCQMKSAEHCPP